MVNRKKTINYSTIFIVFQSGLNKHLQKFVLEFEDNWNCRNSQLNKFRVLVIIEKLNYYIIIIEKISA